MKVRGVRGSIPGGAHIPEDLTTRDPLALGQIQGVGLKVRVVIDAALVGAPLIHRYAAGDAGHQAGDGSIRDRDHLRVARGENVNRVVHAVTPAILEAVRHGQRRNGGNREEQIGNGDPCGHGRLCLVPARFDHAEKKKQKAAQGARTYQRPIRKPSSPVPFHSDTLVEGLAEARGGSVGEWSAALACIIPGP